MPKLIKQLWAPFLVLVVWIAGNVLTNQNVSYKGDIQLSTADELLAYANRTYGAATLVSYRVKEDESYGIMHDAALDFDYELFSHVQKTRNPLPFKLEHKSTFMSCYQKTLISRLGTDSLKATGYPEHPDMYIIAESEALAVKLLDQLKELDSRKLLGLITLQGTHGQKFGCYNTVEGKLKPQEDVDRDYFTYKFEEIIAYPYTYEFVGTQDCFTSEVPDVNLQEVYAYYEYISKPVPTKVRLYWFEFASGSRYYIANFKGLAGEGKYYTNFPKGG